MAGRRDHAIRVWNRWGLTERTELPEPVNAAAEGPGLVHEPDQTISRLAYKITSEEEETSTVYCAQICYVLQGIIKP